MQIVSNIDGFNKPRSASPWRTIGQGSAVCGTDRNSGAWEEPESSGLRDRDLHPMKTFNCRLSLEAPVEAHNPPRGPVALLFGSTETGGGPCNDWLRAGGSSSHC